MDRDIVIKRINERLVKFGLDSAIVKIHDRGKWWLITDDSFLGVQDAVDIGCAISSIGIQKLIAYCPDENRSIEMGSELIADFLLRIAQQFHPLEFVIFDEPENFMIHFCPAEDCFGFWGNSEFIEAILKCRHIPKS